MKSQNNFFHTLDLNILIKLINNNEFNKAKEILMKLDAAILEAKDNDGNLLFHHTIIKENVSEDLLKKLSKDSTLINSKNNKGMSPLHLAVSAGKLQNINFLLEMGADLLAINNFAETAFDIALRLRDKSIANSLNAKLTANARAIRAENRKNTSLKDYNEEAEVFTHAEFQKFLKSFNFYKATQCLINNSKINLNQVDEFGYLPIHYAAKGNASYLLKAFNNTSEMLINSRTLQMDNTPLHLAAEAGNLEAVQQLLALDADTSLVNKDNHTAFELAIINGHKHLIPAFAGLKTKPLNIPQILHELIKKMVISSKKEITEPERFIAVLKWLKGQLDLSQPIPDFNNFTLLHTALYYANSLDLAHDTLEQLFAIFPTLANVINVQINLKIGKDDPALYTAIRLANKLFPTDSSKEIQSLFLKYDHLMVSKSRQIKQLEPVLEEKLIPQSKQEISKKVINPAVIATSTITRFRSISHANKVVSIHPNDENFINKGTSPFKNNLKESKLAEDSYLIPPEHIHLDQIKRILQHTKLIPAEASSPTMSRSNNIFQNKKSVTIPQPDIQKETNAEKLCKLILQYAKKNFLDILETTLISKNYNKEKITAFNLFEVINNIINELKIKKLKINEEKSIALEVEEKEAENHDRWSLHHQNKINTKRLGALLTQTCDTQVAWETIQEIALEENAPRHHIQPLIEKLYDSIFGKKPEIDNNAEQKSISSLSR